MVEKLDLRTGEHWTEHRLIRRGGQASPLPSIGRMASAVPDPPDRSSDPLIREIERSRRYRHALTFIRIAPGPSSHARPSRTRAQRVPRPGHRRRDALDELAAELGRCLRTGDVAWSDGTALFVLLPETDAPGAHAMLARFRCASPVVAGETDVRVASFPEHGLTHHALRAAVARRSRTTAPAEAERGLAWREPYVTHRQPLRPEQ
jgi:hypothetical protein